MTVSTTAVPCNGTPFAGTCAADAGGSRDRRLARGHRHACAGGSMEPPAAAFIAAIGLCGRPHAVHGYL